MLKTARRLPWVRAFAVLACGTGSACANSAGHSPPDTSGLCPRDAEMRTAMHIEGLIRAVPDLTGDGRDDFFIVSDNFINLMAGPLPGEIFLSFE